MPPKNTRNTVPPPEEEQDLMTMIRAMSAQISVMNVKLDKIDSIDSEMKSVKIILNDLKTENTQLKTLVRDQDKKLADMNTANNLLENRVNNLEQHHRSWSARVLNIPLTQDEEYDNDVVAKKVYALVLLPILQGAVEKKMLAHIPTVDQLLEVAHILPGKAGSPKAIIMRFYNRNIKEMIFKLKKFYAPREEGSARSQVFGASGGRGGGDGDTLGGAAGGAWSQSDGNGGDNTESGGFEGRGKFCFPLYEDLTRATFLKMRAIGADARVKACWTIRGQIRFTLVKNPKDIRKVVSILDPLDLILK